jgi:energy-coupling factor transporter ATP-binding protein EcfA2
VGISDLAQRRVDNLSGGQLQKVALASILAITPNILILDEPTGELDPASSREIFEILRKLNRERGVTIIIVEQKIGLLSAYCDKLAIMSRGELARFAPVSDALSDSEELVRIGVHVPRIATLADDLRARGIYTGDTPTNMADAIAIIENIEGAARHD